MDKGLAGLLAQVIPVFLLAAIVEVRAITRLAPLDVVDRAIDPFREDRNAATNALRGKIFITFLSGTLLPLLLGAEVYVLVAAGGSFAPTGWLGGPAWYVLIAMLLVGLLPAYEAIVYAFSLQRVGTPRIAELPLRTKDQKFWTPQRKARFWAFVVLAGGLAAMGAFLLE